MKINVAVLSDVVNKGVKTEVKRLKQTSNQIKGLSIPSDFEYAGKLKACSGKIDRVVSELSGVGNALAGVIAKYKRAEQINANILADVQKGVRYLAMKNFVKDYKENVKKEGLKNSETVNINNTGDTNIVTGKVENIEKENSNKNKIENTTPNKEIQNINKSLKNKQKDLKEDIIKGIPKDLSDIEKMRIVYLRLNQTMEYLNNLGHATGSKAEKIKIDEDVFDVSKMSSAQILGGKWTAIYAELLKNIGIDPNRISIKSSEKGEWVIGRLGKDQIAIAYNLFDEKKKGFITTTEKELNELLSKYDMEQVLQIIDKKQQGIDNKNEVKELMKEFMKKYSIEDNSKIFAKDNFKEFIGFMNNKKITIIDAFSILKMYTGKNAIVQNDLFISENNIIDVVTITGKDEQGNSYSYYMYSKNDSELSYTNNISKIING